MDTTYTFYLPFGEMTITPVDFATITRVPSGGRSMVFDDRMRTLDCPGMRASLRAVIGVEPTISDQKIWSYGHRVLYMPGLFGFNSDVNERSLSQGRASRFDRRYAHTTSDVMMFQQLLNSLSWDWVAVGYQHRWFLLPGLFYDMYYLGERVYKWKLGQDRRRVPHDIPHYMLSTRSIRLEQDIAATQSGSLLVHIPRPTKFDPFAEAEDLDGGQGATPAQQQPQLGKRMRGGSDSRALDTAVVVGKPEHKPGASFSFILDHIGQIGQDILEMHLMSPIECLLPTAHMCPLMTTMRYASCTKQRGSNWPWRGS
ncbi:hypothetical protein JCGZ_15393 [Jatropha curcas]|uniref:Aminotransferase-like plant mobile domain-containing protein n=1 Tax=Jatropha curcas TaxID=180498 RepID=A0A067K5I0_JATCU|nr:hypothetical protein JCGZ_15393 [Jatropha curcas]